MSSKVAVITGAARGIGLSCARAFAREDAVVIATDIDVAGVEAAALAIGPKAIGRKLDVRSESDWQRVLAEVVKVHGCLDVLVNNAGVRALCPIWGRTILNTHHLRLGAAFTRPTSMVYFLVASTRSPQ